ncbi:CDGSH iron-sulfur domain-containing protein [Mycobacterium sp. 236(2023)]|uniref:CDGSH iron-sulfur domain-containing protein n=1 Tax=Mycobacterium sp. 236(2023) TaxID=3038163 RepID=UPI0024157BB9|nr:CDGSH iron-sulfur domain-containing protein [Mycobacterium sp. 236(2023)]MDG4667062.1 CDGSH iron-sulfur domain-containing protein [Mycobacterium sp. 236(2023)]
MTNQPPRLVRVVPGGPVMVEGPVRVELPDGSTVESDRFMVAICACRRSKMYPLCDTSHRRKERAADSAQGASQ